MAGIAALAAIARVASYPVPVGRDTGQLLYGGRVILDGGTPYKDAALNKGPASYPLFALVDLMAGRSAVGLRLTLLLFVIIAALAIAGYVRGVAGSAAGLLAGLLFALLSSDVAFQGTDPNLPQYAVVPMTGALFLAGSPRLTAAAGAGAMTGFAAMMSPAFLFPLIPAVPLVLWQQRSGYLTRVAVAVAAAAAVVASLVLWLALTGALDDLFVQVPGTVRQAKASFFHVRPLLAIPARGLWLAGLVGCVVAARQSSLRLPALAAGMWIVLSWARVKVGDYIAQDPEYVHHYYPGVVGIVLGLSLGIASVWSSTATTRVAVATLVLATPVTSEVLEPQWDALAVPPQQRQSLTATSPSGALAAFIDRATTSQDRIFVAGSNPELYWRTDRRAPTRFFDAFPVTAHPAYRSERKRDLERSPPRAVVALPSVVIDSDVRALLDHEGYRLALNVPEGRVWLRR